MDQPPLWIDRPPSREREGRSDERGGASWLDSTRYGGGWGNGLEPGEVEEPEPRRRWPLEGWIAAGAVAAVLLLVSGLLIGKALDDSASSPSANAGVVVSEGKLPASGVGKVYRAASPVVVSVRVGSASGTGFLINQNGIIVTNAHVVQDGTKAEIRVNDRTSPINAEVLGKDQSSDVAVLRVDPGKLGGIRPLPFADSRDVNVGDAVVAIGYPLGLDRTATAGIVSGLGRQIKAPNGFEIDEVIQTDAAINPGNSGGPLIDARGRVIGINSQIATAAGTQGNIGIGFAVPANTVRKVVPQLINGRQIVRPYLGVSTTQAPSGGALVVSTVPGGPAAKAGLRAGANGDVIKAVDGKTINDPTEVSEAIDKGKPGDKVKVEVQRDGSRQSIEVTLGTRPNQVPQGP